MFFKFIPGIDDEDKLKIINTVYDGLSGSTNRLVAITHWENGAWAKHYVPGERGNIIPNEDIKQEWEDRKRGN